MNRYIVTCLTIFVLAFALMIGPSAKAKSSRSHNSSKETTHKNEINDFARWELRTAPVAFLAKWVTLDSSYRFQENFSFGPSIILYNSPKGDGGGMLTPSYNGYAAGLNGMLYFDSVTKNTWYTSFHAYYEDFSSYGHGSKKGDVTEIHGIKSQAAIGYQWRWSKMTMLTGGGIEYRGHNENQVRVDINNNTTKTEGSNSGFLPFLEFKIGIEI